MIKYKMEPNGKATNLQFCSEDYVAQENEIVIEGDRLPDPYVLYSDSYKVEFAKDSLRQKRNALLAETDWMANKDVTLPAAWKTYRQKLRDLPSGLDTEDKVNDAVWPTKP